MVIICIGIGTVCMTDTVSTSFTFSFVNTFYVSVTVGAVPIGFCFLHL